MAQQLFKVTDAQDGSTAIVQANTKSRAEKFVAGNRFTAQKATPSEITAHVNGGGTVLIADEEASAAPATDAAPTGDAATEAAAADAAPATTDHLSGE